MSTKNPYQKLVKLKVLVEQDTEGQEAKNELGDELDKLRPKKRADCLPGGRNEMRPCPWYGCKYHLGLDINEETGSTAVRNLDDMVHTCDLDVAEIGGEPGSGRGTGITLEEAGEIMDLTRERMRQIEFRGMVAIKPVMVKNGLQPDDWLREIKKSAPKPRLLEQPETEATIEAQVNSDEATVIQEVQEILLDSDGEQD